MVGGLLPGRRTALALQIGHRISTDLDWFTPSHLLETAERDMLRTG